MEVGKKSEANVLQLITYLAAKRAESEGVKEAPFTDLTGVGDTLPRPGLRPLVDEDNSGTVDNVGLHT